MTPLTRLAAIAAAVLVAGLAAPPAGAQPEDGAPADFVSLSEVAPSILQDIRYATAHNFVGEPIDGYQAPMCILTRPAAEALGRAQQALVAQGYSLKVYDCYRPQRAVDEFVAWAADPAAQEMKGEFYPWVDKSQLFADGYIAEQSGHSRGSTVDVTLVALPARQQPAYVPGEALWACTAPAPRRFADNSVDMGTGYDCFDPSAHTLDPGVQGEQLNNRLLLKQVLESQGFENYSTEWWHFTFRPESHPDTYFDFPVAPSSLAG
ncbi:MAG: M15 family metallopeptidase [Actinomycetota bacterium]|nr:M15 family metallopeptidase [Actinomycetota bacterium]